MLLTHFRWQHGVNCIWIINGTNLVYYTNIGYFPSKFPVVEKYNDDNGVCDDSHTSYYKYYNFHWIKFLWIISIDGGVGKIGNILIFLIHTWKLLFWRKKIRKILLYNGVFPKCDQNLPHSNCLCERPGSLNWARFMLQWFSDSFKSLNSVKLLLYLGKTPMRVNLKNISHTQKNIRAVLHS